MIHVVSEAVAKWLEKEGTVPSNEQALFTYAVYSFLFGMVPILLAFVLGLLFRMLQESFIMILPFMLIRKFSGGYHLNNPKKCVIFSGFLLSLALWGVKQFLAIPNAMLLSFLAILSTLSLWMLSPIENDERKLSEGEKRIFRKVARILSVVTLAVYLVLQVTVPKSHSIPIGVGIVLVAVLQLPCIPGKVSTCDLTDCSMK